MLDFDLLRKYIQRLFKEWYVKIALILEVVGILLLFAGIVLPLWVYLTLLTIALIIAGYSIYVEDREKLEAIKADYEQKLVEKDRRVSQLLVQQPLLELGFLIEGQLNKRYTIHVEGLPSPPDIERQVQKESEELKRAYDHYEADENPEMLDIIRRMSKFGVKKEYTDYNKECEEYLRFYRGHLQNVHNQRVLKARLRQIFLAISNDGTAPAEDVTILLDFPDPFEFPTDDKFLEWESQSRPTAPPRRPDVHMSIVPSISGLYSSSYRDLMIPPIVNTLVEKRNVRGPYYKAKNSTEVQFEVDQLMHNFMQPLDALEFKVDEAAVGKQWEIAYSIHAGNLPRPVQDSLYIEIIQQDKIVEEN